VSATPWLWFVSTLQHAARRVGRKGGKIKILQKLIERSLKNREGSIQNQLHNSKSDYGVENILTWNHVAKLQNLYAASFESPGATRIH